MHKVCELFYYRSHVNLPHVALYRPGIMGFAYPQCNFKKDLYTVIDHIWGGGVVRRT